MRSEPTIIHPMTNRIQRFSNFSRALQTSSVHLRPDHEERLGSLITPYEETGLLARGRGLSYSDCCVYDKGTILDTSRFNHLLSFDETTGIAVVQGAVTFADLFLVHPAFIPPVVPGTLYATLAGGIANDIHGKNNPNACSIGAHVEWLQLHIGRQSFRCSLTENEALFKATIGGLGLTGIITQVALRLRRASRFISRHHERFTGLKALLERMQHTAVTFDYQAAWIDLLHEPRAVLSLGNHAEPGLNQRPHEQRPHTLPSLPCRLISKGLMQLFNRAYYHQTNTKADIVPFSTFNNPLDTIHGWNHVYGKRGLLQFQAVFDEATAHATLSTLLALIQSHRATPTLAVLKYFTESGHGMLSFPTPGFTIAIDFIHNEAAQKAIKHMNQCITASHGKIYLAKDLFLTPEQFSEMYKNNSLFRDVLSEYKSPMRSDLSQRIGLTA